ncbi:peptidoglycan-binding protein [Streptomyces sp. NPDC001642]|uniref:peptidoglycan-binding protein n=1 Tax=Streptomyces sp. NPDC001642 TaxID=3154392 RepID=UPI003320F88D
MNEAKGHICPQCGAPRAADGSPSCACTQQAADALRDTRTAEAAAAEDFDPLRIRPYVELDGEAGPSGAGTPGAPEGAAGTAGDTGETQRLPAVEETMLLRAVPPISAPQQETSVLPTLRAPSDTTPNATDLSLFEDGGSGEGGDWTPGAPAGEGEQNTPRRRLTKLLAVAGAVVAVTAVAGFASGLFSYEPPSRDDAAPQDVRASVPTESESAASATPTSGSPSAEPTTASPTPSLSETPSPTASATPSATPSKSANPSRTPTPTATASTAAADNHQSSSTPAPVLQRGDEGPEVTELQLRLTQLRLYTGPDNGIFDKQVQTSVRTYQLARGITSDGFGVYGPTTRSRLESETSQP